MKVGASIMAKKRLLVVGHMAVMSSTLDNRLVMSDALPFAANKLRQA